MSSYNKVAVYGAGGDNIGRYILNGLVADPAFEAAVLSRKSSKSKYPPTVKDLRVSDELPHAELVEALRGQDVVVSAVGFGGGALESQFKVIDAAIEAGVKRFVPSEYGFDNVDPKCVWLSPVFKIKYEVAMYLEKKAAENPSFSWTAFATGIWLEWALGPPKFLGIDAVNHTVSYWDDGIHTPTHTTLPYASQGVIECLKKPEETKNKRFFMAAFSASQREIVAELEKQQGVKYGEKDPVNGEITVQDAHQRWETSSGKDYGAAINTVVAAILMKEYDGDFVKVGKTPMLEDFVKMPKVSLQDVVKMVVEKQK